MNTLDADLYRINIKDIKHFSQHWTPEQRIKDLGMLAVATGVPVIIVATYLGEIYGLTPELIAQIDRLKLFYHIDQVLNIKE